MDVLTSRTGKRNQRALQFDVCCKVTDQISTVVGGVCILKKVYANLHLLASQKEKIAIQICWSYWLKRAALEQLKNMHFAWATFIAPQDMAFQS